MAIDTISIDGDKGDVDVGDDRLDNRQDTSYLRTALTSSSSDEKWNGENDGDVTEERESVGR